MLSYHIISIEGGREGGRGGGGACYHVTTDTTLGRSGWLSIVCICAYVCVCVCVNSQCISVCVCVCMWGVCVCVTYGWTVLLPYRWQQFQILVQHLPHSLSPCGKSSSIGIHCTYHFQPDNLQFFDAQIFEFGNMIIVWTKSLYKGQSNHHFILTCSGSLQTSRISHLLLYPSLRLLAPGLSSQFSLFLPRYFTICFWD